MADNSQPSTSTAAESRDLFRQLQGEVTEEQFQAWNEMKTQTSSLLLESPLKQSGSESDALLSPKVLANLQSVSLQSSSDDVRTPTNTLSVSAVWDILDPSNPNRQEEEEEEDTNGNEERDESVLNLADAASRANTISLLQQAQGQSAGSTDFSAIALGTPEVLAKYLTGKLSFEDFFKVIDDTRKNKSRSERSRKRKADVDYVYEEDDDFDTEDEDQSDTGNQDDSWYPDSERPMDLSASKGRTTLRKPRRKQWELPKSLRGLMGETHTQVARGCFEEAIGMCLELIRRAPNANQPYDTLGMIYDEQGDTTKATEFYLMSAYLKRNDTDVWVSLANRLLKQNEVSKAMQCFNQAVKYATDDKLELLEERCSLYEQMGEIPKALMGYTQMLNCIESGSESDDKYLHLARKVCEKYHSMKRTNDAARVLTTMFKARPSLINSEDVNKLLDLRMTMKQYQACLEGLVDYCGVEATLDDGRQWNHTSPLPDDLDLKTNPKILSSVRVPSHLPQGFPLELLAKLCSCLIYLGFCQQAEHLVANLMKESVEENGERYLDVADAYMEADHCKEALPILRRCVNSKEYSQAAVWLRYGECLSSSGQLLEAVDAFSRVVELAPNHLGARVSLSALQQQIGRHDEALQVLSGDGDGSTTEITPEDQTLLLHKCHLLFSQKRLAEFEAASRRLLFHYFRECHRPEFLKIVFGYKSIRHRLDAMRTYMRGRPEQIFFQSEPKVKKDKNSEPQMEEHKVSTSELWDLYLKLCSVLLEMDKLDDLAEVSLLGLTCPAFTVDPDLVKDAEFLCMTACLMNNNSQFAYSFAKGICLKNPDNKMAWNLFCQSLLFSNEIRHHKFCLRRLLQSPNNLALALLNGHNSVQNGSYRCALGEYVEVFRRTPKDPLINLCIGLCYIHMSCQRHNRRKEWLILQGVGFLNSYLELRGQCQEAYYNFGRAMHQLDLNYAAVFYYKKALALPPVLEDEKGIFDVRREAAHNLSLIYQKSGNTELARLVIRTYLVV